MFQNREREREHERKGHLGQNRARNQIGPGKKRHCNEYVGINRRPLIAMDELVGLFMEDISAMIAMKNFWAVRKENYYTLELELWLIHTLENSLPDMSKSKCPGRYHKIMKFIDAFNADAKQYHGRKS
jgi:hypothetical protein